MKEFALADLAARTGARLSGDPGARVNNLSSLEDAGEDSVAVAADAAHVREIAGSRAGAVVVPEGTDVGGRNILFSADPRSAFRTLLDLFSAPSEPVSGVSPSAHVAASASIGEGAWVGPGAFVGDGAHLGARCRVHPLAVVGAGCSVGEESEILPCAVLYPGTTIGRRVRIHAGAVLGSDGFGYERGKSGEQRKVPQIGNVVVEDDVEIGALSAIDRATVGSTRVGAGTKIDNLVQVGHNVRIGEHCCLISQSGVAGSSRLGRFTVLAGQAGVADHVVLAEGTVVGAQAGVHSDLPGGTWLGTPALPVRQARRVFPHVARLPETARRVKELEERVAALETLLRSRAEAD